MHGICPVVCLTFSADINHAHPIVQRYRYRFLCLARPWLHAASPRSVPHRWLPPPWNTRTARRTDIWDDAVDIRNVQANRVAKKEIQLHLDTVSTVRLSSSWISTLSASVVQSVPLETLLCSKSGKMIMPCNVAIPGSR